MPIVSDAGPILSFARSGLLELLRGVVPDLIIPTAVYDELWTSERTNINAVAVGEKEWIKQQRVRNRNLVESLPRKLHLGEREAIVLAQELGLALRVDDREARKEAQRLRVPHFGGLRILKEAKERSFIRTVRPALDDLVRSGTYIGGGLYREFLKQVGESDN
jgi:predicted nucleic acid-binding protein